MNGTAEALKNEPPSKGGGRAFSPAEKLAESVIFPLLRNAADSVSFLPDGPMPITVWKGRTCYSWPGLAEFLFGSEGWHSVFWTFGRLVPEFAEIERRRPGSVQELEILLNSLGLAA